jgi:ABC-2 type transport system permease protein
MTAAGAASIFAFGLLGELPWLLGLLRSLPPAMRSFLGINALATPGQLLDTVLLGLLAPVAFMTFGIGVGSRAFGRIPAHGSHQGSPAPEVPGPAATVGVMVAMVVGGTAMAFAAWAGVSVAAAAARASIDVTNVGVGLAADMLLGVCFGAMALLIGARTGRPGLAGWGATGVALVADVLHSAAAAIPGLAGLRYGSLLYYADGGQPAVRGVSAVHLATLLASAVVLAAVVVLLGGRRPSVGVVVPADHVPGPGP